MILIAALVLLIRKTDAFVNPQFWAEDGSVFFIQQYLHGARALLIPYAGYLHLVPRVVALSAAALVPYAAAPLFYNLSSLVLTLAAVGSVFSPRFKSDFKPLIALAVVLVPQHANEIFLTITNVQWVLTLVLVLVLLKEAPDRRFGNVPLQAIADLAVVVICGLTGPFIVVLLPFFAWRWIKSRRASDLSLLAAATVVSALQLYFILSTSVPSGSFEVGSLLRGFAAVIALKVFVGQFFGSIVAQAITSLHPSVATFTLLGIALVLYVITVAWILLSSSFKNTLINVCVGIHIAMLAAAFFKARDSILGLIAVANGNRYFYVPYVMMAWCLIALAASQERRTRAIATTALVLMLGASITSGFHSNDFTDYTWGVYSQTIGTRSVAIPINPSGWKIEIPARGKAIR